MIGKKVYQDVCVDIFLQVMAPQLLQHYDYRQIVRVFVYQIIVRQPYPYPYR